MRVVIFMILMGFTVGVYAQGVIDVSPVPQPYPYIGGEGFSGPHIPESPDPLVAYRWPDVRASDGLEIYTLKPKTVSPMEKGCFENLESLIGENAYVTVCGAGSFRFDFGVESAAWIEFDSPDCPGEVEMSISEYNQPGIHKTGVPVKYGNTYRLELNDELYDGVRFGWITVKGFSEKWHITNVRAVCQIKPSNYNGSFSCSDSLLTKNLHNPPP